MNLNERCPSSSDCSMCLLSHEDYWSWYHTYTKSNIAQYGITEAELEEAAQWSCP